MSHLAAVPDPEPFSYADAFDREHPGVINPVRRRNHLTRDVMTLGSPTAMAYRLWRIDIGFVVRTRKGLSFVFFNGDPVASFLSLRELGSFARAVEVVAL